ncbi:MAG TPA: hypothetical protein PKO44_04015 [Candidatus Omnitrophota bacterium]|nr:hypothetical protein [Candidatus Omnitrophota bacterium]
MINIPNLIQSLNSIDLSKFDAKLAMTILSKRRDILIIIITVVVMIFSVRHIFAMANERKSTAQSELSELETKQKTALAFEAKQKEFDDFQQKIPDGFSTETEVIKSVVGIAENYGVRVLFYNPKEARKEESFALQTVDFVFESSFEQMLNTVKAIERNSVNLQINSWKNTSTTSYRYDMRATPKTSDNNVLQWEISVSSIKVKK